MSQHNIDDSKSHGSTFGHAITLIRGFILITLGLSLLITEQTRPMLFNAIGLFWIVTGIAGIRQKRHPTKHPVWRVFSVVVLISGILVLTRDVMRPLLAEEWLLGFLGVVILLNGLLHLATRYRRGKQTLHGLPLLNTLLGVMELILGPAIILRALTVDPLFFDAIIVIAVIWALVGGVSLLGSVLYRREQSP